MFFKRLSEPSTHAGVALLLQAAKSFAPQYAGLIDIATMLFGSVAVALPEKAKAAA